MYMYQRASHYCISAAAVAIAAAVEGPPTNKRIAARRKQKIIEWMNVYRYKIIYYVS